MWPADIKFVYITVILFFVGQVNSGFSGRLSGNGSSDNLSEDSRSPAGSSSHGTSGLPNKRKKSSMAKALMDKALPSRKKKKFVIGRKY